MTMRVLSRIFENSTDAVFGIDSEGNIRFWNSACEKLFGYTRDQVQGRKCAGTLCGTDLQGHRYCGQHCRVPKQLPPDTESQDFDLVVRKKQGDSVWLNIGAHYIPAELQNRTDDISVFFCMRPVSCQRLLQRLVSEQTSPVAEQAGTPANVLSRREVEVLRLAANGDATTTIADALSISSATVRNHFKNIFAKLDVHSRVEAVTYAIQHHLI